MIIYPAIDIKEGNVVRLAQGHFDMVTEYSGEPALTAKHWERKGAKWLHVIDLDGAQTGERKNTQAIFDIVKAVNIPVQTGGGIRTQDDIKTLLDGGIARVILGTKIVDDRMFLKKVIDRWGNMIAVSLDCANGMVAQHGWTQTSELKATELVLQLEALGLSCLIYTDIARDGMLTGPNLAELSELAEATNIPVIASGGVAELDDIKKLLAIEPKGVTGVITGKALYEGKLNLQEALALCSQSG